jgi:hypothetical protein
MTPNRAAGGLTGRLLLLLAGLAPAVAAQSAGPTPPNVNPGRHPLRNPPRLQAVLPLAGLGKDRTPRVRFEWDAMPRASGYLLIGSVTDRITWTVRSTELRVTSANALEWTATRVQYATTLEPGMYSWKVVALYPDNDQHDFSNPAAAWFEVPDR